MTHDSNNDDIRPSDRQANRKFLELASPWVQMKRIATMLGLSDTAWPHEVTEAVESMMKTRIHPVRLKKEIEKIRSQPKTRGGGSTEIVQLAEAFNIDLKPTRRPYNPELVDDIGKLLGWKPHDGPENICRADNYYAKSLESKWGEPIAVLEQRAKEMRER